MAKYIIDGEDLTSLADAIREQTGETEALSLDDMKVSVGNISGINFSIVSGTTEPLNPSENTIWVNTENEITKWYFSATTPETVMEGLIWFYTGTVSVTEFNALKENGVQVYPLSAKQYIDGAWVDVNVKSYKNSEWINWWNGQLYVLGEEYNQITGGWVFTGGYGSKSSNNITSGNTTSVSSYSATVETSNLIDLTNFKTLTVHIVSMGGNSSTSNAAIQIRNSANSVVSSVSLFSGDDVYITDYTTTLDISILTGGHKIVIYTNHTGSSRYSYVTFDSVIMS